MKNIKANSYDFEDLASLIYIKRVISPNKEYIVKNFDTHSNRNGKFLLANKKINSIPRIDIY